MGAHIGVIGRNARMCPKCKREQSRVINTRVNDKTDILERRRVCMNCGTRWSTVEINRSAYGLLLRQSKGKG